MLSDYFSLAFNNLRKRGLRSWLTILGIFIGIAAVVSLISLGAGLKAAVLGQFGGLAFDVLTVQNQGTGFGPPGSTVIEKLSDRDVELIEDVRGVERVIPRILRVGSLEYNGVSGFGYAIDLPNDDEDLDFIYERFELKAAEGSLLEESDTGKVMLGNYFAETDDFEKKLEVGKKVKINGEEFEVGTILEKSDSAQMNSLVFMMN
jgi:putative ABC transport system permease protein